MLKLKLQYFGHLMQRADSFEKTLMVGKVEAEEGDDRGWDGWMASLTGCTWIWGTSRSWWWKGKPGVLQSRGLQRVGHNWAAELNWTQGGLAPWELIPNEPVQGRAQPHLLSANGWKSEVKLLSRVRLWDPVDCNLPGSSVHGIFQARILEWVAISFFRWSSQPRDQTRVSCIGGRRFNLWATREDANGYPKQIGLSWKGKAQIEEKKMFPVCTPERLTFQNQAHRLLTQKDPKQTNWLNWL